MLTKSELSKAPVVFIFNTDGFQEHTKKAVAGVAYRVRAFTSRNAHIQPVDPLSAAPSLNVGIQRLKLAGGSTTPEFKEPESTQIKDKDVSGYVNLESDSDVPANVQKPSLYIGASVAVKHLDGVAPKWLMQLAGYVCEVIGRTKRGSLIVRRKGKVAFTGGVNNAGTFHVHPRRCISVHQIPKKNTEVRQAVKAPENGPVPVDEFAYSVLPTAGDGALYEILEYRLPMPQQTARAVTHLMRVDTGYWMYFPDTVVLNKVLAAARYETHLAKDVGSNWVYVSVNSNWLKDQLWMSNTYGSFIPALTWPSMSPHLMKCINNITERKYA